MTLHRKTVWLFWTAFTSFLKDDCLTKAATLTFYTLQSIVPLLAFFIALAKGFGLDLFLEKQLTQVFSEQEKVLDFAIDFANMALNQLTSGLVLGFGILLLLWSCTSLLSYMETVFNSIWRVKVERNILEKIKDYVLILLICPFILVLSSGFTLFLQEGLTHFKLLPLIKLSTPLLFCVFFFILYALIPNLAIRYKPRLIASLISGFAFLFWQFFYIKFQLIIFNYSVVYGTFALLPLFLIWLQVSWIITLFGAEISATLENRIFFGPERGQKVSQKELAVLVLYLCLKAFYGKKTALTNAVLAKQLKVAPDQIQEVLDILKAQEFLTQNTDLSYLPTKDPEQLFLKTVADAMDESRGDEILIENSEAIARVKKYLAALDKQSEKSDANVNMKKLCSK